MLKNPGIGVGKVQAVQLSPTDMVCAFFFLLLHLRSAINLNLCSRMRESHLNCSQEDKNRLEGITSFRARFLIYFRWFSIHYEDCASD